MGTIASNGGNQSSGGGGGGGAGGRIAVYLYINNTYLGNYESHGDMSVPIYLQLFKLKVKVSISQPMFSCIW
jgi:hypothetical protein